MALHFKTWSWHENFCLSHFTWSFLLVRLVCLTRKTTTPMISCDPAMPTDYIFCFHWGSFKKSFLSGQLYSIRNSQWVLLTENSVMLKRLNKKWTHHQRKQGLSFFRFLLLFFHLFFSLTSSLRLTPAHWFPVLCLHPFAQTASLCFH